MRERGVLCIYCVRVFALALALCDHLLKRADHLGRCARHVRFIGSLSQSLLFDILVRACLFLEVRWSRSVCWWQSVSPITHFELVNGTNMHYDSIALRETGR